MHLGQNFVFGGQKYYFLPFLFDTCARKLLLYLYIFIIITGTVAFSATVPVLVLLVFGGEIVEL